MTETIRVRVPARFYDDHYGRDLPSGVEISRNSKGVVVDLDAESFRDLLADARFYVEMGVAEFGTHYLGLVSSAAATVRALEAVR